MTIRKHTPTHADIVERMGEIHTELQGFTRFGDLTRSQQLRFDAAREEFHELDEQRQALERSIDKDKIRAAARAGHVQTGDGTQPGPRSERGVRSRALDVLEGCERSAEHLTRGQLDAIATSVETAPDGDGIAEWVVAAGSDHYRSAFTKLMRDPKLGHLTFTEDERVAFGRAAEFQRAMSLTDSAGGYLVPFQLDPTVLLSNTGTSNTTLRSAFRVVQTTGDVWHGVSSAGVTAEWLAESAEAADASPTLAQPSVPVHKGSAFVPVSIEAHMDARNIETEVAKMMVDAKLRLEATAFLTGSGTGQPKGLITAAVAASKTVSSATADTYAVADVYAVKKALPARWRDGAAWLANEDIYDLTRQFATGTGPQSAFWADLGDGTPSRLLGKPTYETTEMDGTVTGSTTNYLLAYGDLKQYVIADRIGTTIEFIPHLFGENGRPIGQRGWYMYFRTGGDLIIPDAVRVLNS